MSPLGSATFWLRAMRHVCCTFLSLHFLISKSRATIRIRREKKMLARCLAARIFPLSISYCYFYGYCALSLRGTCHLGHRLYLSTPLCEEPKVSDEREKELITGQSSHLSHPDHQRGDRHWSQIVLTTLTAFTSPPHSTVPVR